MGYLLIVSVIWAFSFGLVKSNLGGLDSTFLAFTRLLIALPVFLIFFKPSSLKKGIVGRLLLIGILQYGITYMAYMLSFRYLESYQVSLFIIFMPLYIIFINNLYSKRLDWGHVGLAALAVAGAVIIKYRGVPFMELLYGFLLIQIANIAFGWGEILYRRLRREHTDLVDKEIYAVVFVGALLLTALMTTVSGTWGTIFDMNFRQVVVVIFLSVLATGLGFFWWNKGAVQANIGTLAVFHNFKIPLAIAVSVFVFKEQVDLVRLPIGTGVIGLAVYLSEKRSQKQEDVFTKKEAAL